jgi:hypothetical protein
MYVSATNDRNMASGSSPAMRTVRTAARSTPRTHEATSAMSAVCMCTSRTAGSVMAGGRSTASSGSGSAPAPEAAISHTSEGSAAARSMARRAPSAISSRATSGCRLDAPNLVNDSLTTTRSASARNGPASAIACWSPVIRPTGAWQPRATSALIPLSPTPVPFSDTCEITVGL